MRGALAELGARLGHVDLLATGASPPDIAAALGNVDPKVDGEEEYILGLFISGC